MATFYSSAKNLTIWFDEKPIKFRNGVFSTKDKTLIKKLREYKNYGKRGLGFFTEKDAAKKDKTKIVKGARGGGSHPLPDEEDALEEIAKELGDDVG